MSLLINEFNCFNNNKNPHRKLKKKIDSIDAQKETIEKRIFEEAGDECRMREIRAKIDEAFKGIETSLWLHHEGTNREIKIHQVLGKGGQKKVWKLCDQFALILPNYDFNDPDLFMKHWKHAVDQEVNTSQFLEEIGLLSCRHQLTHVVLKKDSKYFIPSYLSESFDSLKRKNIFIIEGKSNTSGTWLKGKKQFLFHNPEDRNQEKCWDQVFAILLKDITKIVRYTIPATEDAFNIAVVKHENENLVSPYQIRYFGLDFSRKEAEEMTSLKERDLLPLKKLEQEVFVLVDLYVSRVMEIEFHGSQMNYSILKTSLVHKYATSIVQELSGLCIIS